MKALIACLKKEWQEAIASYRLLIIISLFGFFGLMNVVTAKFTPQILASLVSKEFADAMPAPVLVDVWLQFFKNIGQVGLIAVIILFSGTLTTEYSRGTLTLLLTKGLARWKILASKSLMNIIIFTLGYLLAVVITYGYGMLYFDKMVIPNLFNSLLILWIFTLFLISLLMLGSVLFNSNYMALLFVGLLGVGMMVINIIPDIKKFNPINLGISSSSMVQGNIEMSEMTNPLVVTMILMVLIHWLGIKLFNKKLI